MLASVMSFPFGVSQWQRAMTVRKVLQEIIEKHPRFHNITPLKTKHVVHWCRCHGYTPPDPETLRNEEDSIEDVLTQIDSEPGECGTHMCCCFRGRAFFCFFTYFAPE